MAEVEVIKAVDGPILRKRDYEGNPLVITRQRVAAYVRVSTDDDEQLESFQSQKKYYQEKISENRDWVMVGIYADEAITGTKVDKREQFQRMIQDCMEGKIDVIMTKSVSRFSRNTVDILQYVRLLKERGIAVIFEKENINTMTEQGEMMLTLMGTLAQNEVESTSKNVKMGIKMKMKRGELMGFNGCLGYDYHPEDKTITVNEAEAETVRLIFELYLQGYGTYTIARRLTELGRVNKKGQVKWTDSGVRGIIKNEKYKGDFTEADKVMIGALAEKLRGDSKLTNMALSSDPRVFAESIFPQAFNIAAQDSYMESQETYTSLFEDTSKYNAIMSTLADMLYHEMRLPSGKK